MPNPSERSKRPEPPKQASGGARLKAAGRHPQLIGWEPEDWAAIVEAAAAEKRSMTQFVVYHALLAARKALRKSAD